jgi:hypothetical protein
VTFSRLQLFTCPALIVTLQHRSVFNVLRNERVSQLLHNFLKTRKRDEQYDFVSR